MTDDNEIFDECKHSSQLMIGILKDDEEHSVGLLNTTGNDIKFYVQPLSEEPKMIQNCELLRGKPYYIGIDRKQKEDALPNFYRQIYDIDARIDELKTFYHQKLIVYYPRYTVNRDESVYKNLDIYKVLSDIDLTNLHHFDMIPRVNLKEAVFEELLKANDYFDLPYYDGEFNRAPEFIVCGDFLYTFTADHSDVFIHAQHDSERWKCTDSDAIIRYDMKDFTQDLKEHLIKVRDEIYFIETNCMMRIKSSGKERLPHDKEVELMLSQGIDINELNSKIVEEHENMFLDSLYAMAMKKGLSYEKKDLINFHTSIKTNPITILAGMSGTGKTQLALQYAKQLGLSEDNHDLLFMPISPSYSEPGDVLGYLNSINGLYIPSDTGLTDFLVHAFRNPTQMHMVIFDEMNLSQIEYWFSPFISILEKDPKERYLRLYDQNAHCNNSTMYPDSILINENIIFVGTVNIDETTKSFSDRLLDRVFMIHLHKQSFLELSRQLKRIDQEDAGGAVFCKEFSMFDGWKSKKDYIMAFDEHPEEIEFLDQLDVLLQRYFVNGGISYRVLKNIGNYLNNIPLDQNQIPIIDRKEAFDMIVKQAIMTKIRGSENQIERLVGRYHAQSGEVEQSELYDFINRFPEISAFENVKKVIQNKAEELCINGYVE